MSLTAPLLYDHIPGLGGYQFLQEINSGYFGRVYLSKELTTENRWACKVIEKTLLTQRQVANVVNEVSLPRHHCCCCCCCCPS